MDIRYVVALAYENAYSVTHTVTYEAAVVYKDHWLSNPNVDHIKIIDLEFNRVQFFSEAKLDIQDPPVAKAYKPCGLCDHCANNRPDLCVTYDPRD